MAATKLKVTYSDGREVQILASPKAQVETARHFRGLGDIETFGVEVDYYLAWASLHYAGQEAAEFDAWLVTIGDIETVPLDKADEQATDPTPAAATPTGSSS